MVVGAKLIQIDGSGWMAGLAGREGGGRDGGRSGYGSGRA